MGDHSMPWYIEIASKIPLLGRAATFGYKKHHEWWKRRRMKKAARKSKEMQALSRGSERKSSQRRSSSAKNLAASSKASVGRSFARATRGSAIRLFGGSAAAAGSD